MDPRSKHPAVRSVVEDLIGSLGPDWFVQVDHWEGDETAIGIARPDDHRVLVYIAIDPDTEALFYECEMPTDVPDRLYEVASRNENADRGELLAVVRSHLTATA